MKQINNAFYDDLGDRWFEGDDHVIALLRAESRIKVEYVKTVLAQFGLDSGATILDVACGGGLVALPLAEAGYRVKGIDLSEGSIEAACRYGRGLPNLEFQVADAYQTGEPFGHYDAVLLLDMLEHVEKPAEVLAEASRVTRSGGVVIFHTFNRTIMSRLLAVYGMRFLARDTPDHVHLYNLFVTPEELTEQASEVQLAVREIQGIRPMVNRAFWWSVAHRRVHPTFAFKKTASKAVGYLGYAVKEA